MPKNPPRDNQRNRVPRTVQSGPTILRRVMQRSGMQIALGNQSVEPFLERLPESLRKHVIRVVPRGEDLVILTDSAAWAARLKLVLAQDPALVDNRLTSVKVAPRGAANR